MNISYNWLKSHIQTDVPLDKVAKTLTNTGLEVEAVEKKQSIKGGLEGIIVGEVIKCEQHTNADKLKLTQVNIGNNLILQIVCGASNVTEGMKVAVATIGSILYPTKGESFQIKKSKIRGEDSFGMLCGADEVGIVNNNDGLLILPKDAEPGSLLSDLYDVQQDYLIEIGLTPNRADAMSHFGVARDLHAGLKVLKLESELIASDVSEFSLDKTIQSAIEVIVENKEDCPRYMGLELRNITIKESPKWLKNRLITIGLNPINNIVDITNYILHDLGQPLHAFDSDKITGNKIIVKNITQNTLFTTLDGVKREVSETDLMICDAEKPLAIAGILGGQNSGVTTETKNIFLESAYFKPITVRKSSKRHQLNTDASFRFERGVDPNGLLIGLKKAAILMQKYADATIISPIFSSDYSKFENKVVILRYHRIDKLLGNKIHRDKVKEILNLLDINIISEFNDNLEVSIPSYRVDVEREIDLIEEILRIYGYNSIEIPEKMTTSLVTQSSAKQENIENNANYLVNLGFNEVMNNSLVKKNYETILNWDINQTINILNPLSGDLSIMRQSLLPGMLETLNFNISRKNSNLKIFELGKSYKNNSSKTTENKSIQDYTETKYLALAITGKQTEESWLGKQESTNFFHLKGLITQLLAKFGIKKYNEIPLENVIYSDGLELTIDNDVIAILGKLHSKKLTSFEINQDVYYATIDWSVLVKLALAVKTSYTDIAKYPTVRRDLALLADKDLTYKSLYDFAQNNGGELLQSVNLFDVYEGDKLPENKKSYALSFLLQDKNKTLTDKEIEEYMTQLLNGFEQNLKVKLRG